MIVYSGNRSVRPCLGGYDYVHQRQIKMQHSTAEMSSNRSESNRSTSKYSFKTGRLQNLYNNKLGDRDSYYKLRQGDTYYIQSCQNNIANLNSVQTVNPIGSRQRGNNFADENQNILARSKSHTPNFKYFKPIPDPPQNLYSLPNQVQLRPKCAQKSQQNNLHKKSQLQQGNSLLKKSISQRKLKLKMHFTHLNTKVSFLKTQFQRQQQKMQRITAVINEYFG